MKDTHDGRNFDKDEAEQDYVECITYYTQHPELQHSRSFDTDDPEGFVRALRAVTSLRSAQFEQNERNHPSFNED